MLLPSPLSVQPGARLAAAPRTLIPPAWPEQKVAEVCSLISTRALITLPKYNTAGLAGALRDWLP